MENSMSKEDSSTLSFDAFDELTDPRPHDTDFMKLTDKALSRRGFLHGTATLGATAFVMGAGVLVPNQAQGAGPWLSFDPIAANDLDTVTLPKGFSWQILVSWGDPLWSRGAAFDHTDRGTGASQELAFGSNNDGMALFSGGGRSVLAVNNEYLNIPVAYANRKSKKPETADDIRKSKAAHGVSVVEIKQDGARWDIVTDSPLNRRITADTPMEITGPARGHEMMRTAADSAGATALGTWNNCGSGRTPWGTYLTCEENFNGYFASSDPDYKRSGDLKRYGIGLKDRGYAWATADERFDISKHPNEPNRFGYIVEIDPFDPTSTPKKRTALGRFKHENAELVIAKDGRVVVYLGDDERGEFLYRFVSAGKFGNGGDNRDLLEDGTLYVAKFSDGGRGEWLELTPRTTGLSDQAEISIRTRQAASAVGATTMDRPEWVAANPTKVEAYCALTNNKNRGKKPNAGGDATPVGGPNPRKGNVYGQIVRWVPDNDDHSATGFAWDLYVMAGNPTVHSDANGGSKNITADNMFNSPDGIAFDTKGGLWIQTDGNDSNKNNFAGQGNNQMLLGDTKTGEIKRFLVGPKGCEVTGLTWSADRRTMFVGIQHPGEKAGSNFPGGAGTAPRSSVIAITRDDGGAMG
jgi:secreted PhoX family phosphatase